MKRIVAVLVSVLSALILRADPTIRVEVHNIVELSERFNVVFVVEGEHAPSDFQWEPGNDFTVVWGPQKGTSTSVQMINGKTTRSSQTSYTYILQARSVGTFTLPSATAKVKGVEVQSRKVSIQVVGSGSKPQSSASSGGQASGKSESSSARSQNADIFMRLTLSRSSVVVGEPVTATLKIYHRTNLVGFEDAHLPSFKGFWSQEVEAPSNLSFQREQVDGTMYNSALLRRWVIIPQKAGDVTLDPAELVCLVNVERRRSSGSIFDDFFGNDYVTTRQRVTSPTPTLHVSALPAGAPASFGGGVGEFTIQARLSKDSLQTHDAASLVVTLSGKGNIALAEAPKLNFPPDFELYDVRTNAHTDKSGTSGSKTFEYPFIPRSHGDFVLPPVKYAYYDVRQRRYEVAQTDSLHIHVARSASMGAPVADGGSTLTVERKGVKNLGEDIRFIRSKTSLGAAKAFLVYSPVWWTLVVLLLAAGVALWLGLRKAAARRADVVGTRKRKATRQALKRLSQAHEFLQKDLYTAFYEELHRSLLGFVGDKLTMDMAEQSKENIAAALQGRGVPQEVVGGFTELLSACEEARYAPDAGHGAMQTHYEQAVSLITAIDSSMKKTHSAAPAALLLAALLLLPISQLKAAESYPDSLWRAGVEAYTAGDYATALDNWEQLRSTGLVSRELYYNLGNAYFKTDQLAPALLWWERTLRLDPSDADVRYNLEYARALTQDRIEEIPEIFFEQWGHAMCYLLSSDTWAVLCLVFLAATVALALLFLLGSSAGKRRLGFFAGIATLLLTLLSWDFAQWQRTEALRRDSAIVMRPVSSVKSSPGSEGAKDLFILHEGTKVKVLDQVSGYSNIELSDGRQGWIAERDIELI